jgi:hypothetical protein
VRFDTIFNTHPTPVLHTYSLRVGVRILCLLKVNSHLVIMQVITLSIPIIVHIQHGFMINSGCGMMMWQINNSAITKKI